MKCNVYVSRMGILSVKSMDPNAAPIFQLFFLSSINDASRQVSCEKIQKNHARKNA